MKLSLPASILLFTFGSIMTSRPVYAQPKGAVDCTLEWHSGRQTYTYVFSGVVSCQGKPCANAKIQLQFSSPQQPDLVEETVALSDGSYQLKIAVNGTPQQSMDWKLVAQAPNTSTLEATEIEGRSIMAEDAAPVMVEKPLYVQG